ncbi:MAG: site-specific DNA-methyltransferase [Schwartzia sp.]|nr:site-specific DNA-methyltransferase [Schwartzia sp. (in: firmicutes)]
MYGVAERIYACFRQAEHFTLKEAYATQEDTPRESVRARIYENLGIRFERIAKGLYKTKDGAASCIVIEGDGRDLSMIADASIDCIFTDHPWLDIKSNRGGNRFFSRYDCFQYTSDDFKEKARVLKDGCFLVEVLPAENESNYEYLYAIKQYAKQNGFEYYAKVAWKKGAFVSNTGRKSKNTQDIMIFSKGPARKLRIDKKQTAKNGILTYMRGTNGMLPTMFDVPPVNPRNKIHQSELPVALCESIISFVTLTGEIILDTFAGSGAVGEAALNLCRNAILIENAKNSVIKICNRLRSILAFEPCFEAES